MKVTLLVIGKTDNNYLQEGIDDYTSRLSHYIPFGIKEIGNIKKTKNQDEESLKKQEGELILKSCPNPAGLVLLDENGSSFTSREFAGFLRKKMASGLKELVFVIGGAYGFSPEVATQSDCKISLSRMTFSHQMVRIIFLEQLYRAFTILNGEPYHHD